MIYDKDCGIIFRVNTKDRYLPVSSKVTSLISETSEDIKEGEGEGEENCRRNGSEPEGSFVGSLNYGNLTDNKGIEVGSAAHRRAWEAGHIDYFGRDSFSNIEQQLQRNIEQHSYQAHPTQQRQISPDKTPTSILKTPSNQTITHSNIVPPLATVSQSVTELPAKTNVSKSSTNGTTSTPQQQSKATQSTNVHSMATSTEIICQNVTELPAKTTSTLKISSNGTPSTSQQQSKATQSTNVPPLATSTAIISQNVTELPAKTTSVLKSSSNGTTSIAQKTATTAVVQTSLNEVTLIPQQQSSSEDLSKKLTTTTAAAIPPKTPLHQVTPVPQARTQATSHSKDLPKETTSTGVISQTVTQMPTTTTIKTTPNIVGNRSEQSNLLSTRSINPLPQSSSSSHGRATNEQSQSALHDSKLTSNPLKTSSTTLKESTTHTQRENNPFVSLMIFLDEFLNFVFFSLNRTYNGSNRLNESSSAPLAEHQSNWTVKSTIVTAYTQGTLKYSKRFFHQYD